MVSLFVMTDREIEATFGKRPRSREEWTFSVSSTGHVVVDLSRLFASDEVRRKLTRVAHQVHKKGSSK